MFKKFVALMLLIAVFSTVSSAYAYDQNAATKLARGIVNGVTSWVEIPKQVYLVSKEREPFTGITYGLVQGAAYTVLRVAEAAYDISLFLLPPYDKPLFEPEFVFEGWE
ncbi:MAG: exosortase system-associated protein, TIGR04073 family [Candidatus Omnitrophica bacterium]|nr:exosortase system-associated protein, TIGR04073 family [Candidatus Omnitrophota bacterium]MBU2044212.1 exosortase system-associated protein, TIGR04073 family [Candidatus Omnitrophota bacterium]MBU2251712.1 exosortase system-associated protein, TIGR04073 family [Candidatus Omnitrophota bacterium]MBU2473296.1 exosortase system-associated protein, TIGR04073 family [Candidatus Omnitrophota bacterium]